MNHDHEAAAMLVENERRRLLRIMDGKRAEITSWEEERRAIGERISLNGREVRNLTVKYAELTGTLAALGIDPTALAEIDGYASGQGAGLSDEARKACIAEYQP